MINKQVLTKHLLLKKNINMSKVIKLTEQDLVKLVKKVVNEQQKTSISNSPIPKNHPIYNPLWKEMISNVEGDGVETIKYAPGKMLVIDAFGNKYTITKG
jgi:hypothetical protein